MDEQNELESEATVVAALKAGAAIGNIKTLSDGREVIIAPDGWEAVTFEPDYVKPPRKKIGVTLHDAASFARYVTDFGSEESRIFADVLATTFKAVLDYHAPSEGPAHYCEHTATYKCRMTPEWGVWNESNGKKKTQIQFAEFIENNQPDIVDPAGGLILEIVRTLEAHKDAKFASSIRLDNGQSQFHYEEEIKGSAAKGKLEIPEKFTLGIAPFQGGTAYRLEARLRYRIEQGALSMYYDLLRPQKVLEAAFQDTVELIGEKCNTVILQGSV